MERDATARLVAPVVAGVAAGAVLLIAADGVLVRLGLLAVVLALLATLSIATLKRVLLAVALLEIPIQLDVYLQNDPSQQNAISGLNLSLTTLVLVMLYSLWAAELAGRTRQLSRPAMRAARPALTYAALVAGSVLAAGDLLLAAAEIVILIQAVALFLYLLHHVRHRADLLFVIVALLVGVVIQSLIVLGLAVSGREVVVGPITAGFEAGRVAGTFKSPNILGGYLALLLPPALAAGFSSAPLRVRQLGLVAFALGVPALILSYSRGAWAGVGVALVWLVATSWHRRWLAGLGPLLAGTVLVALVAVFADEIVLRLASYNDQAALSRLPLMELAVSMIRDHPLFGVGANNFAASLEPYVTVDYSRAWIAVVHNKYLLVWAETGVLALIAFVWMLGAAVRSGWRRLTPDDRLLGPLGMGLAAGLVANMVHMTVDRFHFRPQVQLLWVVMAVALALPAVAGRDPIPDGERERPPIGGRV